MTNTTTTTSKTTLRTAVNDDMQTTKTPRVNLRNFKEVLEEISDGVLRGEIKKARAQYKAGKAIPFSKVRRK